MKIREANDYYSNILSKMKDYRTELVKKQDEIKDNHENKKELANLEKEIKNIDKNCNTVTNYLNAINSIKTNKQQIDAGKEEVKAKMKQMKEERKCLDIFRRISSGEKVSPADEQRLMIYNKEMYSMAKIMALMNKEKTTEKFHYTECEEDTQNKIEKMDYDDMEVGEISLELPEVPANISNK